MKYIYDICIVKKSFSLSPFKKIAFIVCLLLYNGTNILRAQVVYDVTPSVDAQEKERKSKNKTSENKILGYRIFLGFSNSRPEATLLLTKAEELFSSTYGSILIYDEPNFKVYVGAFTTAIEADAAMPLINKSFPNARKLRMNIPNPSFENPNTK